MPRGKRDRGDGSAEPALTGPADPSVDISDCTFLLTGALSVLRSEMEAEIRSNGGKVGSISKSTHLLCGPDGFGTNKYNQAERKGPPVVDESWVSRYETTPRGHGVPAWSSLATAAAPSDASRVSGATKRVWR